MSHPPVLLHHSPAGRKAPPVIREFAARHSYALLEVESVDEVISRVSRAYPSAMIIDGSEPSDAALALCRKMKSVAFTAVVPVIVNIESVTPESAVAALEAGADEVITDALSARVAELRLELALRRAERDVSVHPTTRLPGTVRIERDFAERLQCEEIFAVCYADLDHFKEFNDRYGYNHGDRVILIVSRILREVVTAHSPTGFVGHIGGDDFIFSVPIADYVRCCEDVIEIFDELIPLQYSREDRGRGSFLGKDRRGQQYEVPLMTLSIGVVTNENRRLTHPGQISELATEMKAYAKTFPGSLFVVDRRTDREESASES